MSKAEAISVIECATVNAVTTAHQRPELAERDDQAEQEQQVIDAVEDVEEAVLDEAQRRLVPARIELARCPGSPCTSKARSALPGVSNRIATLTRSPSRVRPGWMAKLRPVRLDVGRRRRRRAGPLASTAWCRRAGVAPRRCGQRLVVAGKRLDPPAATRAPPATRGLASGAAVFVELDEVADPERSRRPARVGRTRAKSRKPFSRTRACPRRASP